ncbi:MAG: hypothetical protein ACXIUW_08435 [Roseinatronobacter sp.]
MAGIERLDEDQNVTGARSLRGDLHQMGVEMLQKPAPCGAACIAGDIVMGLAKRAGDEHQKPCPRAA